MRILTKKQEEELLWQLRGELYDELYQTAYDDGHDDGYALGRQHTEVTPLFLADYINESDFT